MAKLRKLSKLGSGLTAHGSLRVGAATLGFAGSFFLACPWYDFGRDPRLRQSVFLARFDCAV